MFDDATGVVDTLRAKRCTSVISVVCHVLRGIGEQNCGTEASTASLSLSQILKHRFLFIDADVSLRRASLDLIAAMSNHLPSVCPVLETDLALAMLLLWDANDKHLLKVAGNLCSCLPEASQPSAVFARHFFDVLAYVRDKGYSCNAFIAPIAY